MLLLSSLSQASKFSQTQGGGQDFPGGLVVKSLLANAGDTDLIPGLGRSPWIREWQPTPEFLPGEFNGQKSLVSYTPWGHKESDTTERLSL